MNIAVIGAGNAGQALAGYIASRGHHVSICDVNRTIIDQLKDKQRIRLIGEIQAEGIISNFSYDARSIVKDADVVMVVTTALTHAIVAAQIADVIKDGQIIVLNPGRTGGALEFKSVLSQNGCNKKYYLCEAQTIVFACRIKGPGVVNIVGNKSSVSVSTLPASEQKEVFPTIQSIIPAYVPAPNVLYTSLENYGAVFHSAISLFNACLIEKGTKFYFYSDVTPAVAAFIEKLDKERVAVGKAYGIPLISAEEWLKNVYNVDGNNLYECLVHNKAYQVIEGPKDIHCRQITEDIPTGAVPICELGRAAGVPTPAFNALVDLASSLIGTDFSTQGRTLSRMMLDGKNLQEILDFILL